MERFFASMDESTARGRSFYDIEYSLKFDVERTSIMLRFFFVVFEKYL